MQFWLSNGDDRILFPVNPSSFSVTKDTQFQDINVVNYGEVTIAGTPKQYSVSFSSFFPRDYNPSYCHTPNFLAPYDATNKIINWMHASTVLYLTVTNTDITFPVTVRSFTYHENGGEPGDVYFDISFKQYRPLRWRTYSPAGTKTVTRTVTEQVAGTYTVKNGDTLWAISKRFYGDATKWPTIYNANTDKIKNPNVIYSGQVLTIPGIGNGTVTHTITVTEPVPPTMYEHVAPTPSAPVITSPPTPTSAQVQEAIDNYASMQALSGLKTNPVHATAIISAGLLFMPKLTR
jgi:LysM repeat protein